MALVLIGVGIAELTLAGCVARRQQVVIPGRMRQAEPSSLPLMPRPRYRQDPLPLGDCAPPPALYGPEQPLPVGLERMEQDQLGVVPLGPLFEGEGNASPDTKHQER